MIRQNNFSNVRFCILVILLASIILNPAQAKALQKSKVAGIFDVYDYAAVGDGNKLDTKAIQAAIDDCTKKGGGKVYLHNGTFLSGTIYLKNNVTLYIEAGATLLGSKNLEDYPVTIPEYRSYTDNYTIRSLIYAEKKENITIAGRGTINGQGESFKKPNSDRLPYKKRPYLMRIIQCSNVMVKNITIRNSPMWVQHYLACDNVVIDGVTVNSVVNNNNDGINIDSCQKMRISNCNIRSGDDAIVFKSTSDRPCKDVTVTNCVISTNCNAFKTGTESNGGFENITISNCTVYDTRLSGIALELVDGGKLDKVTLSNINMNNVGSAIFVRLGNRARPFKKDQPKPAMGSMQNIIISNIHATCVDNIGGSITGLPGHLVQNITLQNILIKYKGGGTAEQALADIPEKPESYPEYGMFGTLPAYGLFCRHVKNLKMHNIQLEFENDDLRPALIFDDVNDLDLFSFDAQSTPDTLALVWLKNVNGAFIHGCRPRKTDTTFLKVSGDKSKDITLMNNDFSRVKEVLNKDKEINENIVYLTNNRTK